ncbi:MAG: hypothetical protein ACPKPY_09365 [Nitrososphaeraceae archaeon]
MQIDLKVIEIEGRKIVDNTVDDHSKYVTIIHHMHRIYIKQNNLSIETNYQKYEKPLQILIDLTQFYNLHSTIQSDFDSLYIKYNILHIIASTGKPTMCGKIKKLKKII